MSSNLINYEVFTVTEYDDDIYPYATFQAWKPTSQVSSQRGFQTFIYQGSDSPGVNSYAGGDVGILHFSAEFLVC